MKQPEEDNLYQLFGQFVKDGRMRAELTQSEVAAKVDLSQGYYSQIESGTRQVTFKVALKICSRLNLNLNDFVNMTTNENKPHRK